MAQRHQAILDAGPGKGVFLQPLVGHHHAAAIPVDQLQTGCLARPEDEDRSGERVLAQLVLPLTSARGSHLPAHAGFGGLDLTSVMQRGEAQIEHGLHHLVPARAPSDRDALYLIAQLVPRLAQNIHLLLGQCGYSKCGWYTRERVCALQLVPLRGLQTS